MAVIILRSSCFKSSTLLSKQQNETRFLVAANVVQNLNHYIIIAHITTYCGIELDISSSRVKKKKTALPSARRTACITLGLNKQVSVSDTISAAHIPFETHSICLPSMRLEGQHERASFTLVEVVGVYEKAEIERDPKNHF